MRLVFEAEQRKIEIREIMRQWDEAEAKVKDLQAKFDDALAHEPSDLVRFQFSQLFDETLSYADRSRAQIWIQKRDDIGAYQDCGDGKVALSTCTLWRLLEDAGRVRKDQVAIRGTRKKSSRRLFSGSNSAAVWMTL